jgi:hypothetical protein
MNAAHFDRITCLLMEPSARRSVVRGLAGAAHGLTVLRWPDAASAKKKKHKPKNTKPTLKRNAFGCVDVGGTCRGNDDNCCSGICEGEKPRKGKKDTSVCVGHDNAGVCFPDSDSCTLGLDVPCSLDNPACSCVLTTGNAGFCGDFSSDLCRTCTRDTDCQADLGPGAACVVLAGACSFGCAATGRTACVPSCSGAAP